MKGKKREEPCHNRWDKDKVNVGMSYKRGTSVVLVRAFQQHGVNLHRKPSNNARQVLSDVKDKLQFCNVKVANLSTGSKKHQKRSSLVV